jgi:hypothetical protein
MSLPPAQQKALDAMAEGLQVSEPRLVSMFAIFTRLTRNEAAPRREQLPAGHLGRIRLPVGRRGAGGRIRLPVGRRGAGTTFRARHHEFWLHVLIASPLAIALLVIGLVFGFGSHSAQPGCGTMPVAHVSVHHARDGKCPVQTGSEPGMFGK